MNLRHLRVEPEAPRGSFAVALQASVLACIGVLLPCAGARADDAKSALMAEPIGYTQVADAFDEGDPIDVDVRLGFLRESMSSTIRREVVDARSADGRSTVNLIDVADQRETRNELALQLDVGVWHDVMVFLRMPIVLGDDAQLQPPSHGCQDGAGTARCKALNEPVDGDDVPLFDLSKTLHSARRSGLRSLEFGAAWAVTNQYRTAYLPTWVLRVETGLSITSPMNACLEGQDCSPGISRGTAHMRFESRWSYRYRLFEPFLGLAYTYEWVTSGDKVFFPAGELEGIVDPGPPSTTDVTLGTAIIPWEDRSRFQRFEIAVRGAATYISSGRDFSPLFDALGSSTNPQLTAYNYAAPAGSSAMTKVRFTGITNVEAYARLGFDTSFAIQAARYVRFALGLGLFWLTPHLITGAPPCNRDAQAGRNDERQGACTAGIVNPAYRPAIDAPGRRFRVEDATLLHLSAAATGQF
jgi:hypothetical protein